MLLEMDLQVIIQMPTTLNNTGILSNINMFKTEKGYIKKCASVLRVT